MKIYLQILIILFFSFVGEALSDLLSLPIPGAIIGMILLFVALQEGWIKFRNVDVVGSFLINNMTILFLPAGVGIIAKWPLIAKIWPEIALIVVLALVINIAVIGLSSQFIKGKFEGDYLPEELSSSRIALDVIDQHFKNKHIKRRIDQ